MTAASDSREIWENSFQEQVALDAFNTAPVEALVRTVSYHLRGRYSVEQRRQLRYLEMGCGAGPNLLWLAQKGIRVSGIDISPTALELARANLERAGARPQVDSLLEGSVTATGLPDGSFDGILEACVFQHLDRAAREQAFAEVHRLLAPGGIFVGYMLDVGHTVFQQRQADQLADDPGSLILSDGSSKIHLTNIGLSHFFRREEFEHLLRGFSVIDPCLTTYYLPREEAQKRGYPEYLQSMWTVYAVK